MDSLMWTPRTRAQHSRAGPPYGSDLTDAEWAILVPFLRPPCLRGRKRKWPMRPIIEVILHALQAGCAWETPPERFPPVSTVYRRFACCRDGGTWETINHHLVMRDCEPVGRSDRAQAPKIRTFSSPFGAGYRPTTQTSPSSDRE